MNNKLIDFMVTFGYVGRAPFAPGTWGSIAALPFAYCIQRYYGSYVLLAAALAVFIVGCFTAHHYVVRTGRNDPKEVVIDEVAGQWLLLAMLYPTFNSYVAGLLLFRFFDILKPWPIYWVERRTKGGFGVMIDDILAALYPVLLLMVAVLVCTVMGFEIKWGRLTEWLAYVQ